MTSTAPRWIMAISIIVLLTLSFLSTRWRPVEDSYISFRYAANASLGQGLVFNPGERVEGFTNLLWTALLSVLGRCDWKNIPMIALSLELLLAISTMLVLWKWTGSYLSVLLLAIFPGFIDNVGTGLEVALLAFLFTSSAYLLLKSERPALGSLCMGLAFLTRPDAGLVGVFVLMGFWLASRRAERDQRLFIRLILPFVGLVVATEVFRFLYYGDVVPNTFHAKAALSFSSDLALGFKNLWHYVARGGFAFLVLIVAALTFARKDIRSFGVALGASAFLVYYLLAGGPSGNQSRFLAPLIPLLLGIIPWMAIGFSTRVWRGALMTSVILGCALMIYFQGPLPTLSNKSTYRLVSRAITPLPAGTKVVFQAIGLVGWENLHLTIIDQLGLTNREVAIHGEPHPEIPIQGHRKWMTADQFFAAKADYYVPFTSGALKRGDCPENTVFAPIPLGPDASIIKDPRLLKYFTAITLKSGREGCVLAFRRNGPDQ